MLWTFCWHLQTPAATRSLRLEASYGSYTRNFTSHTFTLSSSTTPAIATAMCGQSLASCFILDESESEFNLNHSLYIGYIITLSLFSLDPCLLWHVATVECEISASLLPCLAAGPGTVTPLAPAPLALLWPLLAAWAQSPLARVPPWWDCKH